MDQQEISNHYAAFTSPLLTAIRDAARPVLRLYENKGFKLHNTGQDPTGRVPPTGNVVMTRDVPTGAMWSLEVGFRNGQEFYDSINFGVRKVEFPSMEVPIKLSWYGRDDWGRRQDPTIDVPPLELMRNSISWLGRRWSKVSEAEAEWIVKTLLERWLLHDNPDAAEEARRQVPGARWDRVKPLARWGPTEVWKVRDAENPEGPRRVMKVLRLRKGPASMAYKRLEREIEITQRLGRKHDGIVEVIEYGIPKDGDEWTPFYVMPLAETTLRHATDLGGNLEAVLNLGITLAKALAVAHEEGVIHRDVKPDNVLLYGPERRPVLADFGICFLATEEGGRLTGSEANTVGPANYVAPELLGGRAESAVLDSRADIYSLGKTLYYALAGGEDLPREYQTQDRYDLRRRFDDPRMEHFYGLLERMVVENPEGRFPSMSTCIDALERALASIKKFVPYTAGMYGGVVTAVERYERLKVLLSTASGLQRSDGVREAIAEASRTVEGLISDTASSLAPPAYDTLMSVAVEASESLLAVGLPLLTAGESEGFERWLDELVAPLLPDGTGGMSVATNVRRAASVLAFHGVAVTAWRRERFAFLNVMLRKYEARPDDFIHLSVVEQGSARAAWRWIAGSLPDSHLLARAAPEVARDLDESLLLVAGVVALFCLLRETPEELAKAVPDQGQAFVLAFPGFCRRPLIGSSYFHSSSSVPLNLKPMLRTSCLGRQ